MDKQTCTLLSEITLSYPSGDCPSPILHAATHTLGAGRRVPASVAFESDINI